MPIEQATCAHFDAPVGARLRTALRLPRGHQAAPWPYWAGASLPASAKSSRNPAEGWRHRVRYLSAKGSHSSSDVESLRRIGSPTSRLVRHHPGMRIVAHRTPALARHAHVGRAVPEPGVEARADPPVRPRAVDEQSRQSENGDFARAEVCSTEGPVAKGAEDTARHACPHTSQKWGKSKGSGRFDDRGSVSRWTRSRR